MCGAIVVYSVGSGVLYGSDAMGAVGGGGDGDNNDDNDNNDNDTVTVAFNQGSQRGRGRSAGYRWLSQHHPSHAIGPC